MYAKEVMVQNQVGLHATAGNVLYSKANEYKSSIWVEKRRTARGHKKPFGRSFARNCGRHRNPNYR